MIDYCVAVIDDVVEGFIRNFTWQVAFSTYWFLFFVEFRDIAKLPWKS